MRSISRSSMWDEVRFCVQKKGIFLKLFRTLVGSKEGKYRYMVECLGVTGDAGGVDVLVFFAFTLLAHPHPHPFFLSP